jgi:hypothetical protein
MTEDFKKWLCEKAGIEDDEVEELLPHSFLEILIKAMFAIIRKGKWLVLLGSMDVTICELGKLSPSSIQFYYSDHNNSEQEALTKALEYIFGQEKRI